MGHYSIKVDHLEHGNSVSLIYTEESGARYMFGYSAWLTRTHENEDGYVVLDREDKEDILREYGRKADRLNQAGGGMVVSMHDPKSTQYIEIEPAYGSVAWEKWEALYGRDD